MAANLVARLFSGAAGRGAGTGDGLGDGPGAGAAPVTGGEAGTPGEEVAAPLASTNDTPGNDAPGYDNPGDAPAGPPSAQPPAQDGGRNILLWGAVALLAVLALSGGAYYYGRMRRRSPSGSYYTRLRGR